MYRTTKKKVVKRASLSIAVALGALVAGVGVANASLPLHATTAIAWNAPSTHRSSSTANVSKVRFEVASGHQSVVLPEPLSRRESGS
jgi:hypothetical protein